MSSAAATSPPDVGIVLSGLKDFQRRTVEHAFDRLYIASDSTRRFLVADEVGLGKTMVARGVVAKSVAHLWDEVDRVDVVYVCSNAEIARQNINRLRLSPDHDFARATRATLLPIELTSLTARVNYVSMTPGTSLEERGGTGRIEERVLIFQMLREHWGLPEARAINALSCNARPERFRDWLYNWLLWEHAPKQIDEGLHRAFLEELDRLDTEAAAARRPGPRDRMHLLCEHFARSNSRVSEEVWKERHEFVGLLRATLGRICIRALRPDLVILDEFQRFKHLLHGSEEETRLARELLDYADAGEAVRVLLLSATPYKMYTLQHELDAGADDHYKDFLATYEFLVRHEVTRVEELRRLLNDYRAAMFRVGDGDLAPIREIKNQIQECLRSVMARSERIAATEAADGMVRQRAAEVFLEESDVHQFIASARIARCLDQGDIVEYWKSAPYLLNFMDEYELKRALKAAAVTGGERSLAQALADARAHLLRWDDIRSYSRIDPANARLRSLLSDTIVADHWKLLWMPPSLPYYALQGPYSSSASAAATKRLVFSSWKVVPKVIAAVVSHEAERRAMALTHSSNGSIGIENSAEGRKRLAQLLRFSRAERRLTGMPVLGIMYPSMFLAGIIDPAVQNGNASGLRSLDDVLAAAKKVIEPALSRLVEANGGIGEIDESWYWVAPLLLDHHHHPERSIAFWDTPKLASEWAGDVGSEDDPESDTAWGDHLSHAMEAIRGAGHALGRPPDDLVDILALQSLGGPGVLALRSMVRMTNDPKLVSEPRIRVAAARVAWRLRNLFNLPEVISLLRGLHDREPYWQRVMHYSAEGCLQSVFDEYAHVLRDSLGLRSHTPVEAVDQIADAMTSAISVRSSSVGFDQIDAAPSTGRVSLKPHRMRARFAARFSQDSKDEHGESTRADLVRAAFNSPFWPFVLASTSVGQEGLDFHHYCHAIVHWNLPSNPVDLEQREGRIHRFKGHAIRKNIVLHGNGTRQTKPLEDPWEALFMNAAAARNGTESELKPFWIYPHPEGATIDRYVPALPLSRDAIRFDRLRKSLAVYRMVFGQPRQEELLEYLLSTLPEHAIERCARELRIDLQPRTQQA
jgi:hypothetical protein